MADIFMDISNDVIFKRIFGRRANKPLLIALLSELIDDFNVVDLQYLSPEVTGFSRDSKNSRMDLRIKTDTGFEVIVEMQVRDQKDFGDRAVYYAALPILEEVESGVGLYTLTPRIILSILHFSLPHLPDPHWATEFRANYSLREKCTGEKLSEAMNLVFIELDRFKKKAEELENDKERIYFCLKHMSSLERMPKEFEGNELMERLFRTTAVESLGKKEKKEYTQFMTTERDIRNQTAYELEQAEARGEARGRAEGKAEGKAEGESNRNIAIAKAMIEDNEPIEKIVRYTGLKESKIQQLM